MRLVDVAAGGSIVQIVIFVFVSIEYKEKKEENTGTFSLSICYYIGFNYCLL
jgi:hypothetical protein